MKTPTKTELIPFHRTDSSILMHEAKTFASGFQRPKESITVELFHPFSVRFDGNHELTKVIGTEAVKFGWARSCYLGFGIPASLKSRFWCGRVVPWP
jgi:hypothetical protein